MPTYTPPTEVAEKLKEEFIKPYLHLFQKEPLFDPGSFRAMGRSGAEAEILNHDINKRALAYAEKVADFWLSKLATQRREDLEGHIQKIKGIATSLDNTGERMIHQQEVINYLTTLLEQK